ncbi:hypothetical protein LUZ60_010083 [Juncus effusus]|nr:hypothetical protein LUZ60_010083 [Juncus effusus]
MENQTNAPHLALLCSPGMGHLIPLAQLAIRSANVHNVTITLMANPENPSSPAYLSLLKSLPGKVNVITLLPPSNFNHEDIRDPVTRMISTVVSTLPQVHEALISLLSNGRLDALVVTIFSFPAKESASNLGLPYYLFYASPCMCLALSFYIPELVESYQGEFRDLPEPVQLPGCVPLNGRDLVKPLQYRNAEMFNGYVHHCKIILAMDGILLNSFEELEPGVLKAFRESTDPNRPKIYAVGPDNSAN